MDPHLFGPLSKYSAWNCAVRSFSFVAAFTSVSTFTVISLKSKDLLTSFIGSYQLYFLWIWAIFYQWKVFSKYEWNFSNYLVSTFNIYFDFTLYVFFSEWGSYATDHCTAHTWPLIGHCLILGRRLTEWSWNIGGTVLQAVVRRIFFVHCLRFID